MLNQLKQWARLPKNKTKQRSFKLIQIEPTLQCGLSCVMCPWSEIRASAGTMTWETFERILPYLHQAESVDLTGGGEPTLSPYLCEMVRQAKAAGCQVGFSTNAARLGPEISEQLIDNGLDWISFSIDAATPDLYQRIRQGADFESVTGNIRALQRIKAQRGSRTPRMMMVFVMMGVIDQDPQAPETNSNYQQLPELIRMAHSLGVEQVIAKNLDVILKEGDDQRRLFSHTGQPRADVVDVLAQAHETAKQLGVGLRTYFMQPDEQVMCEHDPLHNVFINWQGFVSPCITLSYAEERLFDGQRVHAPCQRFGDVNIEGLEAIWNKPTYRDFRQAYEQRLDWEREAMLDALLHANNARPERPAAPESCRTCYYLYGI